MAGNIFRKAIETDIAEIMPIFYQAQEYLKQKGINQWQNNYPNIDVVKNDIKNNNCYVLIDSVKVIATVSISFNPEVTYGSIYEGKWINNEEYAVIHRIAIDNNYKGTGLSSLILEKIEKLCFAKNVHSIKTDTHRDNVAMQKMLKKNGFEYCGIIYLLDGNERFAFEKIL